jgi:hypothetical protein
MELFIESHRLSKYCIGIVAIMLFLPSVNAMQAKFVKYKAVDAYEIRPGILIMPRYASDGQICEIGIEKRHYSPELIDFDSYLERNEIDNILEELAPVNERGAILKENKADLFIQDGSDSIIIRKYENITIKYYYQEMPKSANKKIVALKNIVVVIHWENRKCQ